MRRACFRCFAVCFVLWCAACASGGSSEASSTTTSTVSASSPGATVHAVVALGDSVPYGTACDCNPYPQLTGGDIERIVAHTVAVSNDAVAGARSSDVVEQLEKNQSVRSHVERSDVVMVEVGANDVAHSSTCANDASCYDATVPNIKHSVTTIVDQVHALSHGRELVVVLLDYWSVWLGGEYAQAQGPDYVAAADTVTAHVNDTIRAVAHSTGSIYVDLRTAFRGPDDAWDETHLLVPDGDHPNAEGHQRIAEAIAATVSAR